MAEKLFLGLVAKQGLGAKQDRLYRLHSKLCILPQTLKQSAFIKSLALSESSLSALIYTSPSPPPTHTPALSNNFNLPIPSLHPPTICTQNSTFKLHTTSLPIFSSSPRIHPSSTQTPRRCTPLQSLTMPESLLYIPIPAPSSAPHLVRSSPQFRSTYHIFTPAYHLRPKLSIYNTIHTPTQPRRERDSCPIEQAGE